MNFFLTFLERNHLKKVDVANYLGVSKQYISQVCNGTAELSEERVFALMKNEEWDVSALSELNLLRRQRSKVNNANRNREQRQTQSLPILPFEAVAGYMSDNNGVDAFRGIDTVSFADFIKQGADCVIRVGGDSMYPRYKNGDVLAIKILHDPTFFQWGRVYCLSTNQGCIVKMLFQDPDDDEKIVCHSENTKRYPDYSINKSDILSVAIVVGHAGVE